MNDKTAAAAQPKRTIAGLSQASEDFWKKIREEMGDQTLHGPSRGELHGIDLTQLPEKRG